MPNSARETAWAPALAAVLGEQLDRVENHPAVDLLGQPAFTGGVQQIAGARVLGMFADSITDGRCSTRDAKGIAQPDLDQRWGDIVITRMAERAKADSAFRKAVAIASISGNRVLGRGNGPSALERLERDVLDRAGRREHRVASLPLNEGSDNGNVRPGPRGVGWRADAPATLSWAQDLGRGAKQPDGKAARDAWFTQNNKEEDGRLEPALKPLYKTLDQLEPTGLRAFAKPLGVSINPEEPENITRLLRILHLDESNTQRLLQVIQGGVGHQVLNARKHTEESQIGRASCRERV